jgi:hypothetical protein
VSEEQSHARSPHQQQQDHTHKPQRFALHSHTPFSSPRPLPLSLCVHSRYPTPSLSPTPSRTASRRTASTPLRPTPISAASGSIATVKQHCLPACLLARSLLRSRLLLLSVSLSCRRPSPLQAPVRTRGRHASRSLSRLRTASPVCVTALPCLALCWIAPAARESTPTTAFRPALPHLQSLARRLLRGSTRHRLNTTPLSSSACARCYLLPVAPSVCLPSAHRRL